MNDTPDGPKLPPKPEVALALLQTAPSLYVHLDPRSPEVRVPAHFKKQAQLVLQVGMQMAVSIPDLDVGDEALSCTLSFNRRPEYCWIPWDAIYGLVDEDGRGMIWPDSVPKEVAAAADGRQEKAKGGEKSNPKRGGLRVAGTPEEEAARADGAPAKRAAPAVEEAPVQQELKGFEASGDPPKKPSRGGSPPEKSGGKKLPSYLRVVK